MDTAVIQHKALASGQWAAMSFFEQMANIGSEVSRACRWKAKGKTDRMAAAADRYLELLDLTIALQSGLRRRELLRAREVFCDFFFGDNIYGSTEEQLQRYYDVFAFSL